jgi:hypothetical protein
MEIRKYKRDKPSTENEERLAGRIREKERRKYASSTAAYTVLQAENGRLPRRQDVFREEKKTAFSLIEDQ